MPKIATDGYFGLLGKSPYDVFVSALPVGIKEALENESTPCFQDLRQPYAEIIAHILSQKIWHIHKEALAFNIIQAIKNKQCTVNQGATAILFYTTLDLLKTRYPDIEVAVDAERLTITDARYTDDIRSKAFGFPEGSWCRRDAIDRIVALTIYSIGSPLSDTVERVPFLGTTYGYSQASHAIRNGARMVAVSPHLPMELKERYDFFPSTRIHGRERTEWEVTLHDFYHAVLESERKLCDQKGSRLFWCYFLYELLLLKRYETASSPQRKILLHLFENVHDIGVKAGPIQMAWNLHDQTDETRYLFDGLRKELLNPESTAGVAEEIRVLIHHIVTKEWVEKGPADTSKTAFSRPSEEGATASARATSTDIAQTIANEFKAAKKLALEKLSSEDAPMRKPMDIAGPAVTNAGRSTAIAGPPVFFDRSSTSSVPGERSPDRDDDKEIAPPEKKGII